MTVNIRAIKEEDFEQWAPLFEGYCAFYHESCDEAKAQAVWRWLNDEQHMLRGLVAEDESGSLQGLAHYHAWPISLYGCDVCYLSDLFVNPELRGKHVGKDIYSHLMSICKAEGWPVLTLLTQEGNEIGRNLYEQFGECSDFKFYMSPI